MKILFKKLSVCFLTILFSTGIISCASSVEYQSLAATGDTVYIRGGTYKNFTIADSDTNYNYLNVISEVIILFL